METFVGGNAKKTLILRSFTIGSKQALEGSSLYEQLEKFISAELESRKHTGSSVAVVLNEAIVWSKGFGYRNVEKKISAVPETVYRCASVTKPVVATGFLQLMEKGRFHLDDPVNDHLDVKIRTGFKKEPTIRDLLTHHSGLPTRVPPIFFDRSEALTLRKYISKAARIVQPPGKSYAYCNTAFTIIGHLIELFSGTAYDLYLRENVLKPLEMNSSDFESTKAIEESLAHGYGREGGPDEPVQPVRPYVNGTVPEDPCGSLFSTVVDLSHFLTAHMNDGVYKGHRILKPETLEEMHKLQAGAGDSRSGMALSWFRNIHDGHVMLSHTGSMPGFTNHVAFYPDQKMGVCWLSNLNDGTVWRPPAPSALRIVAGGTPFDPRAIQSVPDEWKKLIGKYGKIGQTYSVKVKDGYLILEGANGMLFLENTDKWKYLVHGTHYEGYELTFELSETGDIKQFDLENQVVPRFVEEPVIINERANLMGSWRGEYVHPYGFFDLLLDVKSQTEAAATDMDGKNLQLEHFEAERGRVAGSYKFAPPRDYVGWGAGEFQVKLDLIAVNDKLVGTMTFASRRESSKLTASLTLTRVAD